MLNLNLVHNIYSTSLPVLYKIIHETLLISYNTNFCCTLQRVRDADYTFKYIATTTCLLPFQTICVMHDIIYPPDDVSGEGLQVDGVPAEMLAVRHSDVVQVVLADPQDVPEEGLH